jgi:hypothetical protein
MDFWPFRFVQKLTQLNVAEKCQKVKKNILRLFEGDFNRLIDSNALHLVSWPNVYNYFRV